MTDENWSTLDKTNLDDPTGKVWNLIHRDSNVFIDTTEDKISIKIARDSKYDQVYTAAYSRNADMFKGGIYEVRSNTYLQVYLKTY